MGLFGKKKAVETPETKYWNDLLRIAITFNQETGTWELLPADVPLDVQNKVIEVRKMVFEYIRQLKEAQVYSHGAVHKFTKESYPWVNKDNIQECINLGQYL